MRTSDFTNQNQQPYDFTGMGSQPWKRDEFYRPFGQSSEYSETKTMMDHHLEWLTDYHSKTRSALNDFDRYWSLNNRVYDSAELDSKDTEGDIAARTIKHMAEALELMKHKAITNAEDASQWRDLSDGYRADRDRLQRQIDNQLWNRIKRGFKRAFEFRTYFPVPVQGPPGPPGATGPRGEPGVCKCHPHAIKMRTGLDE